MKLSRTQLLHLTVGTRVIRAETHRGGVPTWSGEAEYDSLADLTDAIARLAAVPPARCSRMRVMLERPPAQARTLKDLPPVRDSDLPSLVAAQAGRFFRRNGAPLVTDAIWVTNGDRGVTQAAAVEEPLLVAIVAGAAQAGLVVESIGAVGLPLELQLLPTAERAVRSRTNRRSLIRMGVSACALWLIAGALFGARLIKERRDVDAELAAAEAPLAALRDVRREMRAAEAMVISLADARQARGKALATLARLKAAIPDSAVVTSYRWRANGSGLVSGASRRVADVLAAVERSDAVANPRIEGTVVREVIAGRDWERFTIVFGASNP